MQADRSAVGGDGDRSRGTFVRVRKQRNGDDMSNTPIGSIGSESSGRPERPDRPAGGGMHREMADVAGDVLRDRHLQCSSACCCFFRSIKWC